MSKAKPSPIFIVTWYEQYQAEILAKDTTEAIAKAETEYSDTDDNRRTRIHRFGFHAVSKNPQDRCQICGSPLP